MNIGVIFLVRQYVTQIMTNSKHTATYVYCIEVIGLFQAYLTTIVFVYRIRNGILLTQLQVMIDLQIVYALKAFIISNEQDKWPCVLNLS